MIKKFLTFILLCSTVFADNPYRTLNSFNAGELSALLNAREDLAKYQNGCSVMENVIPLPQGGAQKRPGTKYVAEVKTSSLKTRLLPFEFSTSQSYIIEVGNQYMRFYKDGAQITQDNTVDNLGPIAGLLAHWTLEENNANTVVNDVVGIVPHNGVASVNTSTLAATGQVGSGSFDIDGQYAVDISDHDNFSFGDGATDNAFSVSGWVNVEDVETGRILSKYDITTGSTVREWSLSLQATKLRFNVWDDSANANEGIETDDNVSDGWRHLVATYDGTGGASASDGITLYIDGVAITAVTAVDGGTYVAMENTITPVQIGAITGTGGTLDQFINDKIDSVALFNKELTAAEVAQIFAGDFAYEILTPYLTADLFNLKHEQSADVLYITHPDYETRKLSRFGDTDWTLSDAGYTSGPFRTQNSDTTITIAASATTGSVTLTAVGENVFIASATAGHVPSGTATDSKSVTGALFKIVHPIDTLSFKDTLEDDFAAGQTEGVSWMSCGTLYKDAAWTFITDGTWLGTVKVQRNYTIGAAVGNGADEGASVGWESVFSFDGVTTARNLNTTGSEDDGDADYRVIFADDTSGTVLSYFTTDQTEVEGIVEITAVASGTSATGTVIKTLASTDATYKWSEGAWSNFRGWPQTVTFFEDRLVFGGNTAQPDTIWGSVTSDYGNMEAGVNDDEAVIFTLSSRQVNVIEWIIGKDKLLIGTSGAEWTIAGGTDEPLTPSNVLAKQHSTYGSANLQATIANESIMFFQRGKEKMRELAYNWELDSYVAPDMTILANFVTNGGIDDTAFQKTPNSILWAARNDGQLPIFSYERSENVTAWSRMITSDITSESDFESVAVISGSPEDEVWVIVERTIDGSTVRYIEQFQPRDFGSDAEDAYYVDAGITYDSTSTSQITGLDHLKGETVVILADALVQTSKTVIPATVGHWKLNDNAATTVVVDSSSNANNGVASSNTSTFTAASKHANLGTSLDFGGTDRAVVSDDSVFTFGDGSSDSPFSLSAWIFITASAGQQQIITKDTFGGANREWGFAVNGDEKLTLALFSGASDQISSTGATILSGWHHVVCTYDGSATAAGINLYVDNVLETMTTGSAGSYTFMNNTVSDVTIGINGDLSANQFQDKLDNVQIFDSELTTAHVAGIYNGGDGTELVGGIYLDTAALVVQVGLPFTVQMRTMPLSWVAQGVTLQGKMKKVSEVVSNWYNSGDFSVGKSATKLQTYSITGQTTSQDRKTFPAGWDREGYVFLYQKSPEPLTVLAVAVEFDLK